MKIDILKDKKVQFISDSVVNVGKVVEICKECLDAKSFIVKSILRSDTDCTLFSADVLIVDLSTYQYKFNSLLKFLEDNAFPGVVIFANYLPKRVIDLRSIRHIDARYVELPFTKELLIEVLAPWNNMSRLYNMTSDKEGPDYSFIRSKERADRINLELAKEREAIVKMIEVSIEINISRLGFEHSYGGRRFLKDAIAFDLSFYINHRDGESVIRKNYKIVDDLYRTIGKKYGKKPNAIERDIRYSITRSFNRRDGIRRYSDILPPLEDRPTNKLLIKTISAIIMNQYAERIALLENCTIRGF